MLIEKFKQNYLFLTILSLLIILFTIFYFRNKINIYELKVLYFLCLIPGYYFLIFNKEIKISYDIDIDDILYFCFYLNICIIILIISNINRQINFSSFEQVLLTVLLLPIIEEIFFRGTLQDYLNSKSNVNFIIKILIVALFFSVVHMLNHNYSNFIYFFILSIPLSLSYYQSKNLLVPISIHISYNLIIIINLLI